MYMHQYPVQVLLFIEDLLPNKNKIRKPQPTCWCVSRCSTITSEKVRLFSLGSGVLPPGKESKQGHDKMP